VRIFCRCPRSLCHRHRLQIECFCPLIRISACTITSLFFFPFFLPLFLPFLHNSSFFIHVTHRCKIKNGALHATVSFTAFISFPVLPLSFSPLFLLPSFSFSYLKFNANAGGVRERNRALHVTIGDGVNKRSIGGARHVHDPIEEGLLSLFITFIIFPSFFL
jgi:hypothetical protein